MPFNGSGSAAASGTGNYPASDNTLIEAAKHNALVADFLTMFSTAILKDGQQVTTQRIPFAAGIQTDTVTEKTADAGVTLDSVLLKDGRVDTTQGADIASAATINLETATGNVVDVTGVVTITAITLSQGHFRIVRFTGALTLTHGASLVLPGAANITTAAGDYALFTGYASSVVRCAMYIKASAEAIGPFVDTNPVVKGSVDGTKKLRFEVDGFTTGNTRVITPPDADLTIPAVTAKGDIVAASASGVLARVAVGSNGQALIADSAATAGLKWDSSLVSGTEQAATSGTAITFTGIPSWAKQITIQFVGVSTNGTDNLLVQLGDSGGVENTGYLGSVAAITNAASPSTVSATDGFVIATVASAATVLHGTLVLTLENAAGFTWVASGVCAHSNAAALSLTAGRKSTSAALDRVSITTTGGVNTFDAGAINILYS